MANKRIWENFDVTAGANSEGSGITITASKTEKRKIISIGRVTGTANVDLVIYKQREEIANIPTDLPAFTYGNIPFPIDIDYGDVVTITNKNGTGSSVTVVVAVEQDIEV